MGILRCTDASGLSFDVTPGSICSGFSERGRYHFTAQLKDVHLYIDEAMVDVVDFGDERAWKWEPGFFAGEVVAELTDSSGRRLAEYRLDVSPDAQKLGLDQFGHMVDELFAFDARLLVGTEAAQSGIGVAGDVTNPHLEYARLRRYGARFAAALVAVSAKPLTRLRHERTMLRQHEVRRLDRRSMLTILRDPAALSLVRGLEMVGNAEQSVRFDASRSYEDLDNPANRTILATLRAVMRRARRVSDALLVLANQESESETRTALAPRVAKRRLFLDELTRSLRRIERANPFYSTRRSEVSAAGLNAISAHPAYASAFRHGWYVLRPGIAGEARDENLWISPTWEIYERWCFLKVVQSLENICPDFIWTRTYPTTRDDCVRFQGYDGTRTISAWLQVRCPAGDMPLNHDFQSVSGERHPDITVTLESGTEHRFIVFDAKYRSSRRSVLDGMQSAHLYRDCLRWKGEAPTAVHLLVPRSGGAPWLEGTEFKQRHRVGVLPLGNESDVAELTHNLSILLDLPQAGQIAQG